MAFFNLGQALRTVADKANPLDGTDTDYDVFGNQTFKGGDRTNNSVFGVAGQSQQPTAPISRSVVQKDASGGTGDESAASLNNGAGGAGASNGYTAADLAYLDAQKGILQQLLERSGTTLNQGLTTLGDSYNKEVGSANSDRSRALSDYQIQDETNDRNKVGALGKVDNNARILNDSLRRILGMAGGSDSTAYQLAAPGAVANDASGKRNNVLEDFGANQLDINTKRDRATEDFDKLLQSLEEQRRTKEGELRTGVASNEQDVLRQMADLEAKKASGRNLSSSATAAALAPISGQIQQRQGQIDQLFNDFRNPTFDVAPVKAEAATLRDYLVKASGLDPTTTAAAQDPDVTAAYYRKKLQEQNA